MVSVPKALESWYDDKELLLLGPSLPLIEANTTKASYGIEYDLPVFVLVGSFVGLLSSPPPPPQSMTQGRPPLLSPPQPKTQEGFEPLRTPEGGDAPGGGGGGPGPRHPGGRVGTAQIASPAVIEAVLVVEGSD